MLSGKRGWEKMSKRMISETIIFDTDWLTEADFGSKNFVSVSIDYQAYDTLKFIVDLENFALNTGGLFQEFEVNKLKNWGLGFRDILVESDSHLEVYVNVSEGNVELILYLTRSYWENNIKGLGSIYIKGVKR